MPLTEEQKKQLGAMFLPDMPILFEDVESAVEKLLQAQTNVYKEVVEVMKKKTDEQEFEGDELIAGEVYGYNDALDDVLALLEGRER